MSGDPVAIESPRSALGVAGLETVSLRLAITVSVWMAGSKGSGMAVALLNR